MSQGTDERFAGFGRGLGQIFRFSGKDDLTAVLAGFGAQLDNPVGGGDDFQVMLNHDEGVASVDELVKQRNQSPRIREMKSRRRLVEDVHGWLMVTESGKLGG